MNTQFVTVCCRTDAEGGHLDGSRALNDAQSLRGKGHLVFLVHGYNNTGPEACASYRAFCALQADAVVPAYDWAFGATVVGFFWPGDARWSIARPAFYPWAIPVADAAGEVLRQILIDLLAHNYGELTVDFVAHSLGNRVVLRTLALVGSIPGLYVRRVVHMAAAVATWKLEQDEADRLRAGMLMELAPGNSTSLYSESDRILADVFPVGETADLLHEGFLPTALGHAKWISSDLRLSQEPAAHAQHRDYWGGDPRTDENVRDHIRGQVRDALALAVSGRREIAPYAIPLDQQLEGRVLDDRSTPTRTSGSELTEPSCTCAT